MACDHGRDRALLLSRGLFGAPAAQAERDRAMQAAEKRVLAGQGASNRDG